MKVYVLFWLLVCMLVVNGKDDETDSENNNGENSGNEDGTVVSGSQDNNANLKSQANQVDEMTFVTDESREYNAQNQITTSNDNGNEQDNDLGNSNDGEVANSQATSNSDENNDQNAQRNQADRNNMDDFFNQFNSMFGF